VIIRDGTADDGIVADRRERFQRHVAGALHGSLLGLLHQDCSHQSTDGGLVWEDADDVAAPFDFTVQALNRIRNRYEIPVTSNRPCSR
jgi:hypothetical protein